MHFIKWGKNDQIMELDNKLLGTLITNKKTSFKAKCV